MVQSIGYNYKNYQQVESSGYGTYNFGQIDSENQNTQATNTNQSIFANNADSTSKTNTTDKTNTTQTTQEEEKTSDNKESNKDKISQIAKLLAELLTKLLEKLLGDDDKSAEVEEAYNKANDRLDDKLKNSDTDKNGSISPDEFIGDLSNKQNLFDNKQSLANYLNSILAADLNKDGKISADEFAALNAVAQKDGLISKTDDGKFSVKEAASADKIKESNNNLREILRKQGKDIEIDESGKVKIVDKKQKEKDQVSIA